MMSMVLATVYNHYKLTMQSELDDQSFSREKALHDAFDLLGIRNSSPNQAPPPEGQVGLAGSVGAAPSSSKFWDVDLVDPETSSPRKMGKPGESSNSGGITEIRWETAAAAEEEEEDGVVDYETMTALLRELRQYFGIPVFRFPPESEPEILELILRRDPLTKRLRPFRRRRKENPEDSGHRCSSAGTSDQNRK